MTVLQQQLCLLLARFVFFSFYFSYGTSVLARDERFVRAVLENWVVCFFFFFSKVGHRFTLTAFPTQDPDFKLSELGKKREK